MLENNLKNIMDKEIEQFVANLKKNLKFKILKDRKKVGFQTNFGPVYTEYTELESENLKIFYVKDVIEGINYSNEITILNKKEDVYAFCNSPFKENIFGNKQIIKEKFNADELKEYIENNA